MCKVSSQGDHCASAPSGQSHFLLQASLNSADPAEMVAAIREVKLDGLREKREEAELTNELRSGERGKLAQQELWKVVAR